MMGDRKDFLTSLRWYQNEGKLKGPEQFRIADATLNFQAKEKTNFVVKGISGNFRVSELIVDFVIYTGSTDPLGVQLSWNNGDVRFNVSRKTYVIDGSRVAFDVGDTFIILHC